MSTPTNAKPRIALFSPLPPVQSGIALYVDALSPYLETEWQIDLVVENVSGVQLQYARSPVMDVAGFRQRHAAARYDQCLFHFGNAPYHTYMLLPFLEYGGISVLHEIRMGGVLQHAFRQPMPPLQSLGLHRFFPELEKSAAYHQSRRIILTEFDNEEVNTLLMLQAIADYSDGILFHSEHAKQSFCEKVPGTACPLHVSALGSFPPSPLSGERRKTVREKWNIPAQNTVFGMFGHIQAFKGLADVVEALCRLPEHKNITLLLAGSISEKYRNPAEEWIARAQAEGIQVITTGFLDEAGFLDAMGMVNIAFALRKTSHGESSAALQTLLSKGIPAIVYDIGSFHELPDSAVMKTPPNNPEALSRAAAKLQTNPELRHQMAAAALQYAESISWPTRIPDYQQLLAASLEYQTACHSPT